jgi:hypothetical protein
MVEKYTKEILGQAVAASNSVSEVLRKLGIKFSGGSHRHISEKIKRFGLSRSHFKSGGQVTGRRVRRDCRYFLKKGRKISTSLLRRSMLEYGIKHVCAECSLGVVWCKRPLVLQIEHKDGDNTNNNPSNLIFLCPNCHSQTETFCRPKTK